MYLSFFIYVTVSDVFEKNFRSKSLMELENWNLNKCPKRKNVWNEAFQNWIKSIMKKCS